MVFQKRAQCAPSQIPYPSHPELAPCASSPELLASPPATPPRGHKRSFSKPMTWLNRSSSSTSSRSVPQPVPTHPASKSSRTSELKVSSTRSVDQFNAYRSGPLGSGATVVRTPQEALGSLRGSTHTLELMNETATKSEILLRYAEKNDTRHVGSPPLPPLPDLCDVDAGSRLSGSSTNASLSDHAVHPGSSSSPTLVYHPSPPLHSRAPSRSAVNHLADAPVPQQPPFQALLLSPAPDGAVDSSKLIVIIETCTTTYRTSLRSLTSRSSHLSRYVTSLLSPIPESASVYSMSDNSDERSNWFNSVFHDHLASAGCLPQSSTIHVFLDRPSAPYAHVLTYLRSLPSAAEQPQAEVLPRAVQLLGGGSRPSPSRLEALLELRDEARYLGLVDLEKLCDRELHRFYQRFATHAPASASGGSGKSTGSVRSFRTVVERSPESQQELRLSELYALLPRGGDGTNENKDVLIQGRGKLLKGSRHEVVLPAAGWI